MSTSDLFDEEQKPLVCCARVVSIALVPMSKTNSNKEVEVILERPESTYGLGFSEDAISTKCRFKIRLNRCLWIVGQNIEIEFRPVA